MTRVTVKNLLSEIRQVLDSDSASELDQLRSELALALADEEEAAIFKIWGGAPFIERKVQG